MRPAWRGDAGRGDDGVETAKRSTRSVDSCGDAVVVAHVAIDPDCTRPVLAQLGSNVFGRPGANVERGHCGALLGEQPRAGGADATAGTRHERPPRVERAAHPMPFTIVQPPSTTRSVPVM